MGCATNGEKLMLRSECFFPKHMDNIFLSPVSLLFALWRSQEGPLSQDMEMKVRSETTDVPRDLDSQEEQDLALLPGERWGKAT